MSEKRPEQPYKSLGSQLRTVRQKLKESVAEVSGAVEIDVSELERIEQGTKLPSEDILMLLISHFGLHDDEAVDLWELAGYDQHDMFCDHDHSHEREEIPPRMTKQPVVLLALDSRVVYSNGAEVVADKSGVVLNFTQFVESAQGYVPVARVGMSYEQAENVLAVLQRALLRGKYASGPKALPPPHITAKNSKRNKKKEK